jgi:hypothetical protein
MVALKVARDKYHRILEPELVVEVANHKSSPEMKQEELNPKACIAYHETSSLIS